MSPMMTRTVSQFSWSNKEVAITSIVLSARNETTKFSEENKRADQLRVVEKGFFSEV